VINLTSSTVVLSTVCISVYDTTIPTLCILLINIYYVTIEPQLSLPLVVLNILPLLSGTVHAPANIHDCNSIESFKRILEPWTFLSYNLLYRIHVVIALAHNFGRARRLTNFALQTGFKHDHYFHIGSHYVNLFTSLSFFHQEIIYRPLIPFLL